MSDVPPETVARGRAIFQRLRGTPKSAKRDAATADAAPGAEPGEESVPDQTNGEVVEEADVIPPPPAVTQPDGATDAPPPESPPESLTPIEAPVETQDLTPDEVSAEPSAPAPETVNVIADPTVDPGHDAALEPGGARTMPHDLPAADARVATIEGNGSQFRRPLPRIIAVANQKGGVGKTTTTVNLGACLADLGYRVLVADLDPQGNASTGVGINIRDLTTSMYDVLLHDAPIDDCIEATSVRNLYVAPSNLELAGAEIELVPAFSRELKLRNALESVRDDYDFVFVDCPPSLGLLTVNSLAAATEVLVPIQCEYYALEGLGQLLRNVGLVQKNLNPALEVSVIVCVMYDARTKLADQVVAEVRSHFGDKVCRTVVPRTVRLSEAPSYGQPISAFDPASRGAIAYKELAKEVSGGTPKRVG